VKTQTKLNLAIYAMTGCLCVMILQYRLDFSFTTIMAIWLIDMMIAAFLFQQIKQLNLERKNAEAGKPIGAIVDERERLRNTIKRNRMMSFIGIILVGISGPYWLPILNPSLLPSDCIIGAICTVIIGPAIVWFSTRKKLKELED
jgi:hypothetical protein